MTETSGFFERPDGERIAWRRVAGDGPTVVWVGGWRSDMGGTKAEALAEAAAERGWDYLRYDHFAHGTSSGAWRKATIGRWREDLIALIDEVIEGPVVLVGSSMGGWVSCLAAVARPERIGAMVLIAPAADFAHALMWPSLTRDFFEEARAWTLLDGPVSITAPVRILQGAEDEPVPWSHALKLAERIEGRDVVFSLIKDGDHRLSRPQDLARLIATVAEARGLVP